MSAHDDPAVPLGWNGTVAQWVMNLNDVAALGAVAARTLERTTLQRDGGLRRLAAESGPSTQVSDGKGQTEGAILGRAKSRVADLAVKRPQPSL
jgi:hypothetical protein